MSDRIIQDIDDFICSGSKGLTEMAARSARGIALWLHGNEGSNRAITIYRSDELLELIEGDDDFWSLIDEMIVGFADVTTADRDCGDRLYQIERTAAEDGYGPLLYDILLCLAKGDNMNGVIPDRSEVSEEAKSVWEHYFYKRQGVEAYPVGDGCELHNDEVLDSYYAMDGFMSLRDLKDRNDQVVSELSRSSNANYSEISMHIWEAGERYVSERLNR